MQAPWLVTRPREPVPGAGHAEQDPPGGEEMITLVQLAGAESVTDADPHLAGRVPRSWPPAQAAVGDLGPGAGDPHRGPEVGQPVSGPGDGHGAEAGSIEREEPDPRASLAVPDVRPHIGLAEIGR